MEKSSDQEDKGKAGTPTLQTVDRALSFLEYVSECATPPTIQQVSDALGLNITTCYHLLRTLSGRGYLKRLRGGKLTIGSGVAPLYRSYRMRLSVNQEFAEVVRALSEETGETAFFSAPEEDSIILKILVEGSRQLRVGGVFVGWAGNEHARASGRAIMPYLDEAHRERILNKCLSYLSKSEAKAARKSYEDAVAEMKERGWSYDGGNLEYGVSGIGWPIFDDRDRIYGAIGLILPTVRLERSRDSLLLAGSDSAKRATDMLKNSLAV